MTPWKNRRNHGSPDDDATQWLDALTTDPADGATYAFGGISDIGVMTIPLPAVRALPAALPAPPSRRPADGALFGRSPLGWALICGVCRHARHATPQANADPHAFDALRESAAAAGWALDALWRTWACPDCQQTPRYWPLRAPVHSAPGVRQARLDGEHVPAKAEFWLEVAAEEAAFERVRASRARTAAIIRPDGRFLTARIIAGTPGDPDYQGRHRTAEVAR